MVAPSAPVVLGSVSVSIVVLPADVTSARTLSAVLCAAVGTGTAIAAVPHMQRSYASMAAKNQAGASLRIIVGL
jgi:hypothetical protein